MTRFTAAALAASLVAGPTVTGLAAQNPSTSTSSGVDLSVSRRDAVGVS